MKKSLLAFFLVPSLIFGLSFESDKMEDLLPYVDEETWVLIDVDNTLIESCMHLGSAQWRPHLRQKVREAGYHGSEAEEVIDRFWLFVQPFVPVRLVDPKAADLIANLRESQVPVFALTVRDCIELIHTQKQLQSVGIDLSDEEVSNPMILHSSSFSLFEEGVIYCGDNSKFEALHALFQEVGMTPKNVVFVDDKWKEVEKMESKLEALGIEFVGIRFSRADARVAAFDPLAADLQFSLLPHLVSDEEAETLIHQ